MLGRVTVELTGSVLNLKVLIKLAQVLLTNIPITVSIVIITAIKTTEQPSR